MPANCLTGQGAAVTMNAGPASLPRLFVRRCSILALLAITLPFAATGCRQDEEIKSYEVDQPDRQKVRLLTAAIAGKEHTWFVKLLGPEQALDGQADSFR